jgi:membrane-bound lytic murein transglycosylase B
LPDADTVPGRVAGTDPFRGRGGGSVRVVAAAVIAGLLSGVLATPASSAAAAQAQDADAAPTPSTTVIAPVPDPPESIRDVDGRPPDLSGVRFGWPDQEPLVTELARVDVEIKTATIRIEAAKASRDEALARLEGARTALEAALDEAAAAAAAARAARADAAATEGPIRDAQRLMAAAAVDAYVGQDLDNLLNPTGTRFTTKQTRGIYAASMVKATRAKWRRLQAVQRRANERRTAAIATEAASTGRAESLAEVIAEAEVAVASAEERARAASARVVELRVQAAGLWAGIIEIGRRPDPTTTTAAASSTSLGAEDMVRETAMELSSGGPLGHFVTYQSFDFPRVVLDAYVLAAATMDDQRPRCRLRWELLAGIGKVESFHGRIFGNIVDDYGNVRPGIRGPALDGVRFGLIRDSDGGAWDGDTAYDRAVGPMQFIPGSWRIYGRDGNGDGDRDPHNYFDAALAAAEHLCRGGHDTSTGTGLYNAVFSYNRSASYVATVFSHMNTYGRLSLPDGYAATAPRQVGPLPAVVFPPTPPASTTSTTGPTSTTGAGSSTSSGSSTSTPSATTEPTGPTSSTTATTDPPGATNPAGPTRSTGNGSPTTGTTFSATPASGAATPTSGGNPPPAPGG